MDDVNRRTEYRVVVPGDFLREAAVWFCPEEEYVRLDVSRLGPPDIVFSRIEPGLMVLTDLSIRGFGLRLKLPEQVLARMQSEKNCFTWLQLWDPGIEDPYGVLSVFTYNQLSHAQEEDGTLVLGGEFVRFAVGSHFDKTLDFLDAQTCGVSALAHWCDNIARGLRPEPGGQYAGLDLDNLLVEVENAAKQMCHEAGDAQ